MCDSDCYECAWDSNLAEAGQCTRCKNDMALLDGSCVAQSACPQSVQLAGKSSFGIKCVNTLPGFVATTTCVGQNAGDGTKCKCDGDCYECAWDSNLAEAGQCTRCKNDKALLDGGCVAQSACPQSVQLAGKSSFGIECVETPAAFVATTTCVGQNAGDGTKCMCDSDCYECAWDSNLAEAGQCTRCRNSMALLDGSCVAQSACPTSVQLNGKSSFGIECVDTAAPVFVATTTCVGQNAGDGTKCMCNNDCYECAWDSNLAEAGQCAVCRNDMALLDGSCVAQSACPKSVQLNGKSSFGITCVDEAPGAEATTTVTQVSTAADVVFVATTTCSGKNAGDGTKCLCDDDCFECAWDSNLAAPGQCSMCKNMMALLDGSCIVAEECPAGFTGKPKSSFGRVCNPDSSARRHRRAVAADGMGRAGPAIRETSSSWTLAAGVAVVALAMVSTLAVFKPKALRRKPSGSEADAAALPPKSPCKV
jgi:hypothetical protein